MLRLNRYLKRSEKIIIFFLVLFIVTAVFYYVTFLLQSNNNNELRKIYSEKKSDLDKVNQYLAMTPDLDKEIVNLQKKQKMLEKMLPLKADFTVLLQEITNYSYLAKVHLIKVKPVDIYPNNKFFETIVEVEINGDYFAILKFIKLLEDNPRFCSLQNIVLSKKESSVKNTLNAELLVVIYSLSK